MLKTSRNQLAAKAADRWYAQYSPFDQYEFAKPIYESLVALGDNPTVDQVNEVIGNNSWTRLKCDECQKEVEEVILLCKNESIVSICKSCIFNALKEIENVN